jgi:hypothetical protein
MVGSFSEAAVSVSPIFLSFARVADILLRIGFYKS